MFPEDIEALFNMVPAGTSVRIVNQPYKLGWGEGGLYLEAHPPLVDEGTVIADEQTSADLAATELTRVFVAATSERRVEVKWDLAELVMKAGRGIPEFVSVAAVAADLQPLTAETESTTD
jgi:L,D-transpeptidase ErfK/SrfK